MCVCLCVYLRMYHTVGNIHGVKVHGFRGWKGTMRYLFTKFSTTHGSLCYTRYGSEEFTKESRRQFPELSVSLSKNFKKGNGRNLPDPSGPLARSAPSLLPTTRKLAALPVCCCQQRHWFAIPACKHRNDDPFPFGIGVYQQFQLPKCRCTPGSLISWLQL